MLIFFLFFAAILGQCVSIKNKDNKYVYTHIYIYVSYTVTIRVYNIL